MSGVPYADMTPAMRAQHDFRNGAGQDDNPYNKETERQNWDAYAWAMHTHWHKQFVADQKIGRHAPQEPDDANRPNEPEPPPDGQPPF
jgi:hypothetical protein